MNKVNTLLAILLLGAIVFFVFSFEKSRDREAGAIQANPNRAETLTSLGETLTNNEGNVAVSVAPLDSSYSSKVWLFKVSLNTHSTDISEDLAAQTSLFGGFIPYQPLSWQGDPPGGHHRNGILQFKPIVPKPKSVTLVIRGVGGVSERKFVWNLP